MTDEEEQQFEADVFDDLEIEAALYHPRSTFPASSAPRQQPSATPSWEARSSTRPAQEAPMALPQRSVRNHLLQHGPLVLPWLSESRVRSVGGPGADARFLGV